MLGPFVTVFWHEEYDYFSFIFTALTTDIAVGLTLINDTLESSNQ